uniref:Acyltransferase n=1 Tax=Oscillatoriales cyanobacterium SpSt-402 TaxID=2282168 RepID=A0A832M1L7_9CYAN
MRGREIFHRVRPILRFLSWILRQFPRSVRYALLALFRCTPGPLGLGIRYFCVHSLARSCGDNVYIGPYTFLSYLELCDIGSNVSIREFCSIGCRGGLRIGNDVMLAAGTVLLTEEHDYTQSNVPMRDALPELKKTVVEDGVWVGARVCITAGITVGGGAVIGAGAVVTHDIPPFSIAAGVPARIIGWRPGHEPQQS